MVQQLKIDVRKSAKRRRGIAMIQTVAIDIGGVHVNPLPCIERDLVASLPSTLSYGTPSDPSAGDNWTVYEPSKPDPQTRWWRTATFPLITPTVDLTNPKPVISASGRREIDMGLIMGYMDYVFPVLFPFYNPRVLDGGRAWLLVLSTSNNGFFNAVSCMSSFFFSVIPVKRNSGHDECASEMWERLREGSSIALMSVQRGLQHLQDPLAGHSLTDSVILLSSIVQLLKFELELMPSDKWQVHLDAAIGLLERILENDGPDETTSKISRATRQMNAPESPFKPGLMTTTQCAFLFYSAIIFSYDIMASTTLRRSPRLHRYHAELHLDDMAEEEAHMLKLDEIIGCQTWVLLLIGDIADLDAWKKAHTGVESAMNAELINRAASLDERCQEGLKRLDRTAAIASWKDESPLEAVLHLHRSSYGLLPYPPDKFIQLTRIWALTARTYLLIVLNGWQPAHPEISSVVAQALELFREITSPSWLRSVIWPLCITGSLAIDEQRSSFRTLLQATGGLKAMGTVRTASQIMENVWSQPIVSGASWDVAACLKSLGHNALLI